jgi:hypothetical protein
MSNGSLILPYTVEDANRKKPFGYDMEIAATLCLVEAKRKKGGILGGSPEKVSFVSKLYYPLWAVPWEDESLIVDGLGFLSYAVVHMKPPDVEAFTEDIKKNSTDRELYWSALRRYAQAFKGFIASVQISVDAIVANESMLSTIFEHVKRSLTVKENMMGPLVLVPPRLNEKAAMEKAEKIIDYWRLFQSEIKGLHYAIKVLSEETDLHEHKILREIEQVQERYEKEILALKPVVEEQIEELIEERNGKIEETMKSAERELNVILKKRGGYERELQKLELIEDGYQVRREDRKRRDDKSGISRWSRRIKRSQKKISGVKRQIQEFSRLIERNRKQCESNIEKLRKSYDKLIEQEEKRILDLEALRDSEIAAKQKETDKLRSEAMSIINQIEQLMEQKMSHVSSLEELAISWASKDVTLVCLPFYLVRYGADSRFRYDVHPLVVAEDYEGIIKRIQKAILSFSLESRINLLLRPKSKALKEIFTSIFTQKTRRDEALEKVIYTLGCSNNLLKAPDFREKLTKGMEELQKEGWISPEEKDMILKAYAPLGNGLSQ